MVLLFGVPNIEFAWGVIVTTVLSQILCKNIGRTNRIEGTSLNLFCLLLDCWEFHWVISLLSIYLRLLIRQWLVDQMMLYAESKIDYKLLSYCCSYSFSALSMQTHFLEMYINALPSHRRVVSSLLGQDVHPLHCNCSLNVLSMWSGWRSVPTLEYK